MASFPPPPIVLYERSGCHLCEDARAHLEQLLASLATAGRSVPALVGRDIDTDPAWHDAFFETIPVVEIGERRLPLATSPARVRRFVEEALAQVTAEAAQGVAAAESARDVESADGAEAASEGPA